MAKIGVNIMELIFYFSYYFGQITPIFILVAYFLINRHFKTTATKVLFSSQLLVVILYISLFFIPGPLANHTQNGEIFKPSELYTIIFSAMHYLRFIPIIALLVFALKLNKPENNN
ncbi:MAG: hypothetical protein JXQ68_06040 [Campylobacterales bacterium]|nr:hypothetical protein [Campylobacterales bacterium]